MKHFCRHSRHGSIIRYVFHYYRAGSYRGIVSDMHVFHNGNMRSDIHIIPYSRRRPLISSNRQELAYIHIVANFRSTIDNHSHTMANIKSITYLSPGRNLYPILPRHPKMLPPSKIIKQIPLRCQPKPKAIDKTMVSHGQNLPKQIPPSRILTIITVIIAIYIYRKISFIILNALTFHSSFLGQSLAETNSTYHQKTQNAPA